MAREFDILDNTGTAVIVKSPLSKRELARLDRLRERCDVLRARVGDNTTNHPPYIGAWRQELSALEWAIERIVTNASK
jgi:hypothetical protein